jgi:small subunit ribosomal protein S4e
MTRLKRLAAPRSWSVPRKTQKWSVTSSPGPHPRESSLPLTVILRDMLHLCETAREAERIVHRRKVLVDGRVATDPRLPVGIMDVVSIPDLKAHYRMVIDVRGRLQLVAIDGPSAGWKLARVEGKTMVKSGKVQLNLYGGRSLLVEGKEYRTGDTLKLKVPDQKVLEVYKFAKGNVALLIGGAHVGEIGHVEEEKVERSTKPNVVHFREGFNTIRPYVYVVGTKEPEIKLPESRAV